MLDVLINLAKAASEFGTVTEASMHHTGLITIDGVTHDGVDFSVTYRQENTDANP